MNEVKKIILEEGLTYEQAQKRLEEKGEIITRPCWLGYHFRYFDNYCIRLANGEIIVNPEEIYDKDKEDWMVIDVEIPEVEYVIQKLEELKVECNTK